MLLTSNLYWFILVYQWTHLSTRQVCPRDFFLNSGSNTCNLSWAISYFCLYLHYLESASPSLASNSVHLPVASDSAQIPAQKSWLHSENLQPVRTITHLKGSLSSLSATRKRDGKGKRGPASVNKIGDEAVAKIQSLVIRVSQFHIVLWFEFLIKKNSLRFTTC